ncbi:MAG: TIM barrel protein [Candidatus Lokiarchaeota archaeon]|nr:TIM barrel protein [Candidatus Harpocratesius repetitus]
MRNKFENDIIRIGPTGVQKELFKIEGKNGKLRNGKRFEIPEYLASLNLNAYEFPGGRMANFKDSPDYEKFRQNAQKFNVAISLHAPYYISLTSEDDIVYEKSIERLAHTYAWATYLNAKRIVLHPGSYGKSILSNKKSNKSGLDSFMDTSQSSKIDANIRNKITKIVDGIRSGIEMAGKIYPDLRSEFQNICLCPETMGKHGQLGTLSEIIEICKSVGLNKARPCVDFGHLYARNLGKLSADQLYSKTINQLESELGSNVVQSLHIHYSIVEFTPKGEKKHHENETRTWGPQVDSLFQFIVDNQLTPIIINESPKLEPDAVWLMQKLNNLRKST